MGEEKGGQKDRAEEPERSAHEEHGWRAGAEGLLFQSGTGLGEPVYSATVSDIPFSCPKKSPLKNDSAGE